MKTMLSEENFVPLTHQLVQETECRQGSFYSLYSVVNLKIWSWSPKSNQFFNYPKYIKFGQNPSFGSRDRVQTSFSGAKSDIQSAGVTLKMRSRSPKSNYFFAMSHRCFCAVLVKIQQLVQEIKSSDKAHFYSLYSVVTLEIRSRSPKSNQFF